MRSAIHTDRARVWRVCRGLAEGFVFAGAGVGLRWLIDPIVENRQPFLTPLCAVMVAAYLRGSLAAGTALVSGLLACQYLFMQPRGHWTIGGLPDFLTIAFSWGMGFLIIAMTRQRGNARRRAAAAEQGLRDHQELLAVAADAAQLGVWNWDVRTGVIYRSPELERIVGFEPGQQDRSREPVATRAVDEDRARIQAALQDAVRTGAEFEVEGRFHRADGAVRWMYSRGRPIMGKDGSVERVVGIGIDVTERRLAEESLRRSDERFRLALASGAVIVYEQDADLRYQWIHPDLPEYRGAIGMTDVDRLGEPHGRPLYELKRKVIESGEPARQEITVPWPTGYLYFDLIVEPRRSADGKVCGVIGAATDITARRRAELAQRTQAQRLDLALHAARMGIWAWDSREARLEWSKEMFELYAAPAEVRQYRGADLVRFARSVVEPEDLKRVEAELQRKLASNEEFDLEYRVNIGGDQRWFCTRGQKVPLEDGHYQILGVALDVTHRKLVDEELARYRRELEEIIAQRTRALDEAHRRAREQERMAALGTLSAGIGHDMGNLLLPMRLHLESVAQHPMLPADVRGDIAAVRTQAEYLQRLSSSLRLLAVDPVPSRTPDPTDLHQWWPDIEPLLRTTLPKGVSLEADFAEDLPPAQIGIHQVSQVVFNLVQNAAEAMVANVQPGARVRVVARSRAGRVLLMVEDNGPGMSPEVAQRCFEPFFSTKVRRITTGMGLSMVRGILEQTGASIEVQSHPGDGSTFIMNIPGALATSPQAPAASGVSLHVTDSRARAILAWAVRSLGMETLEGPGGEPLVRITQHGSDIHVSVQGLPARTYQGKLTPLDIHEFLSDALSSKPAEGTLVEVKPGESPARA